MNSFLELNSRLEPLEKTFVQGRNWSWYALLNYIDILRI
jgi:hypothetical protein